MQDWLHALSVGSVPAEQTYPPAQSVPVETGFKKLEGMGLKWARKRPMIWIRFSSLLALILGFLLLHCVCTVFKTNKRLEPGLVGRRLAGDEDEDFPMPPSPELAFLCSAFHEWISSSSSPGELRTSPFIVEAILQQIEQASETYPSSALVEQQQRSPGEGHGQQGATSTSPPGGSGDDGDGEAPGPSWRLSTITPQPSPYSVPPATLYPGAEAQAQAPHLLQVETGQASAEPELTPVGGGEPSPFTAAPAVSAGQAASTAGSLSHRYVRVPPLQEGATPKAWSSGIVLSQMQWTLGPTAPMLQIRRLLLLSSLSTNDVDRLIEASEELANYMYHRMSKGQVYIAPAKMVRERGSRFFFFSALYSAVQAVGRGLPSWWTQVAEAALHDCEYNPEEPVRTQKWSHRMARDLGAALALYKKGNAPPPQEVIRLKRELLFNDETLAYFKRPLWNPWREDDREASD